jgi:hypothetical protein
VSGTTISTFLAPFAVHGWSERDASELHPGSPEMETFVISIKKS